MTRLLDLAFGLLGVVLFAPAVLVLGWCIRRQDGGPVLFRQERLGRDRRPFAILKLRTMREGRVTPIGRWIRATGLDEVPQFLNVLKGEMSVVGPRPLTAADVARLGWDDRRYDARWSVRPGVAGLAQVFGGRGARVSWYLDRQYLANRSPGLYLGLILISSAMILVGKACGDSRPWRILDS